MKWQGRRQSENVEDRRGLSSKGKVAIGGGIIGIIIMLITTFGGEQAQNIVPVLDQLQNSGGQTQGVKQRDLTAEEKELGAFVSTVFADTEDTWEKVFADNGMQYEKPKMVLFTGEVETGCGNATSSVGPFYCPTDKKVYMDLDFFEELKTRFGAKGGDFAIAYVIAHEVGHHVQTLVGTSAKVRSLKRNRTEKEANKLSVKQELQADFYAGLWAHYNKKYIEAGDIEEALSAANAVGDDAIQKKMQGHVEPDSFTHGTSEQRIQWFTKGFQSGDFLEGDTFGE